MNFFLWIRLRSLERMKSSVILFAGIFVILILTDGSLARRGRGKGKQKSGMGSNRVPLGGKWRDPDTATYYTNPQGARITKASHFDLEYILGHKISFICDARGIPRPHITWFKDGIEIYAHNNMQIHEWYYDGEKNQTHKIKSKMEIDPATQMDAGIYECYADNKYAVDKRTFRTDFVTNFD